MIDGKRKGKMNCEFIAYVAKTWFHSQLDSFREVILTSFSLDDKSSGRGVLIFTQMNALVLWNNKNVLQKYPFSWNSSDLIWGRLGHWLQCFSWSPAISGQSYLWHFWSTLVAAPNCHVTNAACHLQNVLRTRAWRGLWWSYCPSVCYCHMEYPQPGSGPGRGELMLVHPLSLSVLWQLPCSPVPRWQWYVVA